MMLKLWKTETCFTSQLVRRTNYVEMPRLSPDRPSDLLSQKKITQQRWRLFLRLISQTEIHLGI